MELPSNLTLQYSKEEIATRVAQLAAEISSWTKEVQQTSGQQVLCVCILRGAVFFFSDLLREISTSVDPSFCQTWHYDVSSNQRSSGGVRVAMDEIVAEGRSILLVDDICDSGSTLLKLRGVLENLGAHEVRSAVAIERTSIKSVFTPNWVGFEYDGPDWFVGYGMDSHDQYRNVPEIYTMPPSQ